MQIHSKTALITGGASGLGAASARMIVEAGGRVVIADLKPNPELLAGLGESSAFEQTDVTEELLNALEAEMLEAAENLDFERAALLRDRIQSLRTGRPTGSAAGTGSPNGRRKGRSRGAARTPRPRRR